MSVLRGVKRVKSSAVETYVVKTVLVLLVVRSEITLKCIGNLRRRGIINGHCNIRRSDKLPTEVGLVANEIVISIFITGPAGRRCR